MEELLDTAGHEMVPVSRARTVERWGYADTALAAYAQDAEDGPGQGGLMEYWRIICRSRGTLLTIAFVGLLIGVLATLPQTPIYQARTTLEIQDMNSDFVNLHSQNSGPEMGSITNALADIQTQIKILQSDTLTERSLAKLRAKQTQSTEQPDRVVLWRQILGLPQPPKATPEKEVRAALNNLRARAAGQTRIVEVTYDSPDPQRAADFVNALSNEFIEQNVEARWQMMQRTGDWLTKQLDDVRIRLERSEDALQAYARQSGLMFTGGPDNKQNVSEEKLRQLQVELSQAQGDRISKQSRYEMAKNSAPETLPDVLNDTSLRDYQTKITDLRRQQAELVATYKPEFSKVKRIDAQIIPLETALDRERQAILARIRNDYDEAVRRERLLSDDYADQARLVTNDGEKSIQYNILKREVDTNRQIYEAMLQRVKESSITSAMRASNIRVVDAAKPPSLPYKPDTTMNAGLGMLAGLFLGIAFVVMRERADRTLQDPGDASYYLNVPELGIIPTASALNRKTFTYLRRPQGQAADQKHPLMVGKNVASGEQRVELITWQKKPSMVAEAFRVVLTSLLFSGNNNTRPRVLVLTSSSPGEGKSTVTSNLGIALTEIKQRTLIIDADLRKPTMHRIFDLPNEKGLTDLLQQRPLPENALEGMLQESAIPGLFVLTAGPPTSAAANLLYSANFPELIAKFRKEFDMVLIDTPPMLQMPDARVAARAADSVIVVARANKTTRDAALAVRQRFAEDRTKVIGTILNDWNPKNSPNGYYGNYAGYYGKYSAYYGKHA